MFNVACGDQVTLNEMIVMLQSIAKKEIQPIYGPERPGDVRHSRAQITKSEKSFGHSLGSGLKKDWNLSTNGMVNKMSFLNRESDFLDNR